MDAAAFASSPWPTVPQPCPSCGHCPTCGRGNGWYYYHPIWQIPPQPTTAPWPWTTFGGTTTGNVTTANGTATVNAV